MITIETALFMLIFAAFYFTILDFGRLAYAEIVMQQAVDATAMQISQYGYVLTKMGVIAELNNTAKDAEETQEKIDTVKKGVTDVTDTFLDLTDVSSLQNLDLSDLDTTESTINDKYQEIQDTMGSVQDAAAVASDAFEDPEGLLSGLLAVAKKDTEEKVIQVIIGKIVEGQIKSYLKGVSDYEPDVYLKRLGVVDGIKGLRYDGGWDGDNKILVKEYGCSLAANNTQDVVVTVDFYVESPISFFGLAKRKVRLCATTRVW